MDKNILNNENNFTSSVNLFYPQLQDIEIACKLISKSIDDSICILSKEEIEQFKHLADKWIINFKKHKNDVIDNMIEELSV